MFLFLGHQDKIKNVQESKFGQLFSLSQDGVLNIWDVKSCFWLKVILIYVKKKTRLLVLRY